MSKGWIRRIGRSLRLVAMGLAIAICIFLLIDRLAPVDLQSGEVARVVVDADGQPLRAFADSRGIWRYRVEPEQVSPLYLQTLIQYEDRWYYYHFGINPVSLLRAGWQLLCNGRIVSGGSTLTMQVARIRYGLHSGAADKLLQIWRALQLELHFNKREILTYYLNHAPFGGNLEGVEAASRAYFGYSAAHLTRAQAALLAVLPQSPSRCRPDRHPRRAARQRDKVLDRLVDFKVITAREAADAKMEPVAAPPPRIEPLAPLLARRLVEAHPRSPVILTFIDRDIERSLQQIAQDSIHLIPKRASLAIVVMEHGSGKVVGYLGSADMLDADRFGYVDMVTAQRSPGSTLKPFIYGLALDGGLIHSESLLMDVPLRFGDYRPQNFTRGFSGPVSASEALRESLNLPAVQVLEQVGPGRFYARLQTAGADLHLPSGAEPNLALALGGLSTNLEHLVRLYSALANGGETLQPRFTPSDPVRRTRLLSAGAAWIVRAMLHRRTPDTPAGLAVKTGTSYGNRDAWAIAVSAYHTVGVWVGSPDNEAMVGHYGSFTAMPIAEAVVGALPRTGVRAHSRPPTVSDRVICWPGGQPAKTQCDVVRHAWILNNTIPPTLMGTLGQTPLIPTPKLHIRVAEDTGLRTPLGCVPDEREETVAVWPAPLQNWIKKQWRNSSRIPKLDPRCSVQDGLLPDSPVRIVGLSDHDRIKRQAGTKTTPILKVEAVGGQPAWYWFLNGKPLQGSGNHLQIPLPRPGNYRLSVIDQSGMSDRVRFVVEH